ncbi:Acetyltransferase (GNAT) domain/Acetyltransferase (GNAT) family [Novymonas esmeraldas]|uniref:Acetyltransferase (GNAT) domain/Acetyltransferase (GNAT) family n=1 Tax=Novymonas esmeraldas TaxID=1808958 RepID=A0AAW0F3N9_9TRYP
MRVLRLLPVRHRGLATKAAAAGLSFHIVEGPHTLEPAIEGILRETETRQGLVGLPPCNKRPVSIVAKTSDGRPAGGIYGYTNWNELHLSLFAANPECRVRGMGKALLLHMEEVVCANLGCNRMGLETFSWQARPFYEKLGFTVFGTQSNQPRGHDKYFMEKVWPAGEGKHARGEGYRGAAVDLKMENWEKNAAFDQLNIWLDGDTQNRNIAGVPPYDMVPFAMTVKDAASGEVVAYCVYETWWSELRVDKLVVVPDQQHRGIGTAVLQRLEEMARAKGLNQLVADTMSWQARGFYEKHGFTVFATQHDMPIGHSRLRFVRPVHP